MTADDAEERKLRKRLQNRINQRQRRSRKREEAQANGQSQRPYQVDRWRHVYQHDANESIPRRQVASESTSSECLTVALRIKGPGPSPVSLSVRPPQPCPTQDHLLHLIHVNVLRGLLANKMALLSCAQYLTRSVTTEGLQVTPPELVFPCRAALVAAYGDGGRSNLLPASLVPTPLQRTVVHAACIDLFPFPDVRDGMIAGEGRFDLAALVADLVGDLVNPAYFLEGTPAPAAPSQTIQGEEERECRGEGEDDYTVNRKGFILWGEPHRPESWEVTAGFLRRWGWLIKDCRGLIESSNRWREARGEEPLSGFV